MKKIYLIVAIFLFNTNTFSQKNFEGLITFRTKISVTKPKLKDDLLSKLFYKYGDSLQMYYTREGNFKRKYFNSGEYGGLDTQTYIAEEGKLIVKTRDSDIVQYSNVAVNSLKFVSFRKIENEYLMNLDCDCYEYIGMAQNKKKVKLNFCFSKLMGKINYKAFSNYKDFFIDDFFAKAQRPYLKYTMTVDDFTLNFTAIKVSNIDLKKVKF
jgi:hypothetical protein